MALDNARPPSQRDARLPLPAIMSAAASAPPTPAPASAWAPDTASAPAEDPAPLLNEPLTPRPTPPPASPATVWGCAQHGPTCACCVPPPSPPPCVAFRYVQPPTRCSMKPPRVVCPKAAPMDDCSVYRDSYLPVCAPCPERPSKQVTEDNLRPPNVPMEVYSTTLMDFPYWGRVPRAQPVVPCLRRAPGDGCMSDLTTYHIDYRPPLQTRQPPKVVPQPAIVPPTAPMDCVSTMRTSFMAPACYQVRASFSPRRCYNKSQDCFEGASVSRMSYVPWPVHRPEPLPWAQKPIYYPPEKRMEVMSMYGATFIPPGKFLAEPCARPEAAPKSCCVQAARELQSQQWQQPPTC